ncbi:lipid-transfer protein [Aeromicrobium sp. NPDC092404]|uniref:thiolase C-terminal domain-containing protein n=1 Tax=Aeromicrobium sp. NPDC092404 TaxID=3154976 RepID=UPI00342C96E2
MSVARRTFIAGVGMTNFEKPGRREWDYPDMVLEAGTAALEDAGIGYDEVEQVHVGYVYGDSCSGQRAVYGLGRSGVPVVNVNNNCSTGSTALFAARQLVAAGVVDVAMAVGFEKMQRGSLVTQYEDRTNPLDLHVASMTDLYPPESGPPAAQLFGNAGREHMHRHGSTAEHFARIAAKNHAHSVNNPRAQFQDAYSVDEIMASPAVHDPLTRLMCSPTSEGAAAAVVMSERAMDERGLRDTAVEIAGQSMVTDTDATLSSRSAAQIVGAGMTRAAARSAYAEAGLDVSDVQVIELHDCFATNELLTYEALGLCDEGHGHHLVDDEDTTYGGRWVVNPSGGLISKGHPLGATGLAQCAELTWQLRGTAGARQVDDARAALQHNIGLGGAAVVTIYRAPGA